LQVLRWVTGLWLALATLGNQAAAGSPDVNTPAGAILQTSRIKPTGTNTLAVGEVTVDVASRTLRIPAVVNMREQVIEYALVVQTGKTHESLFATEVSPMDVHVAALLVGLTPADILSQTNKVWVIPGPSAVIITVCWHQDGRIHRYALSQLIGLAEAEPGVTTREFNSGPWFYSGSRLIEGGGFIAEQSGSIISLVFDPDALVNNPHPDRDNDDIHFPYTSRIPSVGTAVTIEFSPVRAGNKAGSAGEGRASSPRPKS
jgi:hypothetical protein